MLARDPGLTSARAPKQRRAGDVAESPGDAVCCDPQMARNARPTAAKREREKALIERRQQKAARRQDAKVQKSQDKAEVDGDPDIAHIKLGPQPPADWQIDE
jgi:hypothetical protein